MDALWEVMEPVWTLQYHGWDMDAMWERMGVCADVIMVGRMESLWTLSWLGHGCSVAGDLHYGGAFARRAGAQGLRPERQHHTTHTPVVCVSCFAAQRPVRGLSPDPEPYRLWPLQP